MEKGWVQIASYSGAAIAELKRAVLDASGIQSIIINKTDSSYLFGEVELYVNQDNVIRSKMILDEETA